MVIMSLFGLLVLSLQGLVCADGRNAYATMMYMGTPRDYEFYIATRVMLKSLGELKVDADRVVIASMDVPLDWVQAL
ncbi:putative glucuronosyltransferase pgsip7 [Orobanche hederae]